MSGELSSVRHAVYQNVHHVEWCTKYRFNVLGGRELLSACDASIRRAAARHGIRVLELSVMPQHVHGIIEFPPSMSVSRAEGLLKGASARDMFTAFPHLRERYWGGHFWSAGRFSRSVGDADMNTVRHYVRSENDPHQTRLATY